MSTVWPVCTVYIVLYSIFVFTVWFLSLRLSVVRSQGQDSWRSQSNSRLQGAKRQRPLNCRTGQEDWAGKTLRVCAFVIQPRRVFCVINLGQISLTSGGNTSKKRPLPFVSHCTQLEVKLAERERQVLERELLVDQVTQLSKPLSEQAENCRQDRLTLAKKVEMPSHGDGDGAQLTYEKEHALRLTCEGFPRRRAHSWVSPKHVCWRSMCGPCEEHAGWASRSSPSITVSSSAPCLRLPLPLSLTVCISLSLTHQL